MDLDPAEGLRRVGNPQLSMPLSPEDDAGITRADLEGHRRFEEQPLQFHKRIRDGYLALARENPDTWLIIDASFTQEKISDLVWSHVIERLEIARDDWATN